MGASKETKPATAGKNEFLEIADEMEKEQSAIAPTTPPGGELMAPSKRVWLDPSDQITETERVIPYSKLTQSTSRAFKEDRTAEIGEIISSLGINYGTWIEIIPLWFKRQAALFNKQRQRECFSLDAVTGSEYGECVKCPHYYEKWRKDEKGNRIPPECSKIMTFPAIIVRSENFPDGTLERLGKLGVVAMQFTTTSEPVGKQIASIASAFSEPYYASVWKLWSKDKTTNGNTYRVYLAQQVGPVPEDVMVKCEGLVHEWSKVKLQVGVDDESAGAASGGGGSQPEDFV